MAHSSDRASFESIPTEIRFNIYQYLLSDRNVIVVKLNGTLRPKYQTALFTVNKKISTESLVYFCSENGFVSMKTDLGPFLSSCTQEIPLIVGDRIKHFNHTVLSAKIIRDNAPEETELEWFCTAIFASRHLSNFVRLFNTEHPGIAESSQSTAVHLLYRTKGHFFTPKRRAIDYAVDGIKGIRSVDNTRGGCQLEITVDGDLDMQTAEEIQASADIRAPTEAITLAQAAHAKKRGDAFYATGDYNAARGEYGIAIRIIYATNLQIQVDDASHRGLKYLLFNLYKLTSRLNTQQRLYQLAVVQAEMALRTGLREAGMASPTAIRLTSAQAGRLFFRLACTLADVGNDRRAVQKFTVAQYYLPHCTHIDAKLQAAKARLAARREQERLAVEDRARTSENAGGREVDTSEPPSSWLRRMLNRIRSTRRVRLDAQLDWVTVKVRKVQKWAKGTA
ncbi:hypothetical protein MMC27_008108 [Xylographa pallens]|nr:hypothetical protein [Xylographa pallens]